MKYVAGIVIVLALGFAAMQLRGPATEADADATAAALEARIDVDVQLTEWQVPWEASRPRDPYFDEVHDRVWFVGQRADYAAYLDPSTGDFERFDLPEGAGPHNLIVDREGIVWYAGNRAAHIGRLDPATGDITRFDMPNPDIRDPHTLIWNDSGDIWFTAQGANHVGKLDVETGETQLIEVPTERARPYGIVVDSNNRPWIALFGTNKIATVDPATMELREIELPREEIRPRRIAVTSDDQIWYVDYATGRLGHLDPATEEVREWMMPSGEGARPYAMASDDMDRLWFVETGVDPNRFVGFDPQTEQFIDGGSPESGGGTVRHMMYHQPTQTIWFGTDTNYIGRAVLNEPVT